MLELLLTGDIRWSTVIHLMARHWHLLGLMLLFVSIGLYKLVKAKREPEMNGEGTSETVEIRPGEFEPMTESNVKQHGEHAGFFHSIGRALQGEEVDNQYMKANKATDHKSKED